MIHSLVEDHRETEEGKAGNPYAAAFNLSWLQIPHSRIQRPQPRSFTPADSFANYWNNDKRWFFFFLLGTIAVRPHPQTLPFQQRLKGLGFVACLPVHQGGEPAPLVFP